MDRHDSQRWLQMWHRQQTDEFHQTRTNKYLAHFWPALDIEKGNRVFVPLCGKSLDMLWLASQGCDVIGVELSPIAVADFFKENGLQAVTKPYGKFTLWQHGHIHILCGNYFDLCPQDIGHIDTVYDRAALTALAEDVRKQYVIHLHNIISVQTNVFLLTVEDNATARIDEEIASLYAEAFDIEVEYVDKVATNEECKVYRLTHR